MNKLLRWIRAVPRFLVAFTVLRSDAESALSDPNVRQALDRFKTDPAVAPLVPRLSAEWRAVEETINRMR